MWAGDRGKGAVRMSVGASLGEFEYELISGLVPSQPLDPSAFKLDPDIKEEHLRLVSGRSRAEILRRKGPTATARDDEGRPVTFPMTLTGSEAALGEVREPQRFPVLSVVRQQFLSWRFYHQFRTDALAPARHPQIGVRTPVLAEDGRDLAAAIQTIVEIGDRAALKEAVDLAFPGAELGVECDRGRFQVQLQMPDFKRPFEGRELSDGTLQYLYLLAALLSPRPPSLIALNEPETSVHSDLHPALARLIARASRESQIWVTTHSVALATVLAELTGCSPVTLRKTGGETRAVGRGVTGRPVDD